MNDNDILIYKKFEYKDIEEDILFLSNPDNITRSSLTELFSNKGVEQDPNTLEIKMVPAKYKCTDYFDLPANILKNQPEPVKDTTFGIFIFNSFIIANCFGDKIGYINKSMNEKNISKLQKIMSDNIVAGNITIDEYAKFCNTTTWMGYQTELFMPGMSTELIIPNETIKKHKDELIASHPEFDTGGAVDDVVTANYHDVVETPLLKEAEEIRKNNYAGRLYDMGKPSFGNNYKNCNVTCGPLPDPVTGKRIINTNSFNDGITEKTFDVLANQAMIGSYSRGVSTQVGGTYAKYTGIALQTVRAGPKGSDCGTTGTYDFVVTDENFNMVEYAFMMVNGKPIRIEPTMKDKLVGKTINLRTCLFCKMKDRICNICTGDKSYILGIKNIGLTANVPLEKNKLVSMKKMHDMSVKTVHIDMRNYFVFD